MTRYCRFNGFFEEELKASQIAPERLDLKNRSLENLFFLFQSIRDPSSTMFLSETPDPSWINFWESRGVRFCNFRILKRNSKKVLQVFPIDSIVPDRTWEEWGSVSDLNDVGEILYSPVKADLSRRLNSKILLSRWKSEYGFQDVPGRILEKVSYLPDLYSEWSELRPEKIVLKPSFSFSGRHKILNFSSLGVGDPTNFDSEIDSSWFPCVAEPWLERTYDFSCLYDFSAGVPTFSGSTIQICDEKGKYNGAYLPIEKESELLFSHLEPVSKELAKTFSSEYKGPVAIDGFEFYSQNSKKIQRISEANFRWSMGRILLELSRSPMIQERKKEFSGNLSILPLPLKRSIPEYSKSITSWGRTQGVEILPLTPDRYASGKSYGVSWILLGFLENSRETMRDRIQTFYSEWRKRILP